MCTSMEAGLNRFIEQHTSCSSPIPPAWPAGLKILTATGLAAFALFSRSWYLALASALLFLVFILACRTPFRPVWRKMWLFIPQSGFILGLYILRLGPGWAVVSEALRVSLQIWLAFLPGIVLYHSLSWAQARRLAHSLLPRQTAFVLCTAVISIPLLLREFQDIYQVQLLRGARLRPKDLLLPGGWKDVASSLLFPAVVQCLNASGQIAQAAKLRGFPGVSKGDIWPHD